MQPAEHLAAVTLTVAGSPQLGLGHVRVELTVSSELSSSIRWAKIWCFSPVFPFSQQPEICYAVSATIKAAVQECCGHGKLDRRAKLRPRSSLATPVCVGVSAKSEGEDASRFERRSVSGYHKKPAPERCCSYLAKRFKDNE
jgi:hypothetical protein